MTCALVPALHLTGTKQQGQGEGEVQLLKCEEHSSYFSIHPPPAGASFSPCFFFTLARSRGDLIARRSACLCGWVYIYLSVLLLLDMKDLQRVPEHTKKLWAQTVSVVQCVLFWLHRCSKELHEVLLSLFLQKGGEGKKAKKLHPRLSLWFHPIPMHQPCQIMLDGSDLFSRGWQR